MEESSTYRVSYYDDCSYDAAANASHSRLPNCSALPLEQPEAAAISEQFLSVVRILVPVIFGLIAVLGFFGNLLVIIVVFWNKQMRNTTNILIVSLAIADLLFIVVCVPFTAVVYAVPTWPFGSPFCKAYQYVIHVTAHASVYTLVLMSADRYMAVVHPISSMVLRTEWNTYLAIGVAWFVILGCNVPMLLEFDVISFDKQHTYCLNVKTIEDPDHSKVFYACFFFFALVLPLGIICVLYSLMIRRLLGCGGHSRMASSKSSDSSMRAKRRVTKLVVVVVAIFTVCWLPLQIIFMVQAFGSYPNMEEGWIAVKLGANCLAYLNSCVNPILYAFLSDKFRKSFLKLLGCVVGFQPLPRSDVERTSFRDAAVDLAKRSSIAERSSCV